MCAVPTIKFKSPQMIGWPLVRMLKIHKLSALCLLLLLPLLARAGTSEADVRKALLDLSSAEADVRKAAIEALSKSGDLRLAAFFNDFNDGNVHLWKSKKQIVLC